MPWQLDTAVTTGGLDTSDYDKIRIVRQNYEYNSGSPFVIIEIEYGYEDGGSWVKGPVPVGKEHSFPITGAEYVTLVTHISNDGELSYDATKRGLYEWLFSNGHIDAGTIT